MKRVVRLPGGRVPRFRHDGRLVWLWTRVLVLPAAGTHSSASVISHVRVQVIPKEMRARSPGEHILKHPIFASWRVEPCQGVLARSWHVVTVIIQGDYVLWDYNGLWIQCLYPSPVC